MPPAITVVIPTSGNPERLERTLAGLANQTVENVEVLVCDDGTDDRTAEVVGSWATNLDVHCSRVNAGRGAGYARNRGIEAASADRVLFIDDDCVSEPGVCAFHIPFGDRPVGMIGLRRMVAPEHHRLLYKSIASHDMAEVPYAEEARAKGNQYGRITRLAKQRATALYKYALTCHVSYPTAALRAVGGFWEAFKGAGFEDVELALRLARHGVRLVPFDSPVVYHQNHPQSRHQLDHYAHNKALYSQTVNDTKLVKRGGNLR